MATISLDLVPPFLAVAELGSFSAAATRLRMEKSSVSRAIGRLENTIGERLFLRTTRRVSLTETGQRVRDQLREPHAHLESALSMVLATARQPRGRIVVTAPADFAATVLTGALARFVRRHPHVTVDVRATAQMLDLVGSGIDAAIRIARRRLDDSTVRASKLCELKAGLYAASAYVEARGTPRTPDEALSHPWVAFSALRDLDVHGPDGAAHLRPEPRITSDDMMVVLNAVLQGSGIAALPRFVVDEHVRHGRLVELLPRWTIQGGHLWFLTRPQGEERRSC